MGGGGICSAPCGARASGLRPCSATRRQSLRCAKRLRRPSPVTGTVVDRAAVVGGVAAVGAGRVALAAGKRQHEHQGKNVGARDLHRSPPLRLHRPRHQPLAAAHDGPTGIRTEIARTHARHLGEKVTEAVITVPAYFNDAQRQEEEALQAEAEARLEAEQALRAEEDARLRELYPLPEDEEEYGDGSYAEYQEEAEAEAPAEADGGDTPANGDEDEAR